MYWKICIVGIFQVYKINFFFKKKGPIPTLLKALAQVLLNFTDSRPIPALSQVLLNYTDSRPIPAFLKVLEQVLPMPALSKALVQAFQKRWYRLYSHFYKGYPSAFKNTRTGFESARTYPRTFEKRWYRSARPYPHIQKAAV